MFGRVKWMQAALVTLIAVPMLSGLIGCGASPERMGRYDIVVTPAVAGATPIEVDLVGVSNDQKAVWDSLNVDQYFLPSSQRRQGEIKNTMVFTPGSGPQTLSKTDPIWTQWLGENARKNDGGTGARFVYLIAAMGRGDTTTALDTRKVAIPLSNKFWNNGQQIEVALTDAGLRVMSAQKPQKN
ncbi:MAG: hypothetical protein AAF138_00115 [Planctomycetota bacterium]